MAGAFYPGDSRQLRREIENYISLANPVPVSGLLKGLVEPHAGFVYSGPVAAFGYKLLSQEKNIKRIILLGPSHHAGFYGVAACTWTRWATPLGEVEAERFPVLRSVQFHVSDEVHAPEHCLEVQIPFIQTVCPDARIMPLLLGEVDPLALSKELAPLLNEETIVIASSDLSHYKPYPEARKTDALVNSAAPSLDFSNAPLFDACGAKAILTLMHCAKNNNWKGVLLDYRNSGDTAGDKSAVVGYGCYAFSK